MEVKKVYNEFNPTLVTVLPLKDPCFFAKLTQQDLFSGNLKGEVMAESTQADASTCFLYKAIERPLQVGDSEPFKKLLIVMDECDDSTIKKLAKDIKHKMTQSSTSEG